MKLHGQRVLVTGASSGIGRELAHAVAARGARLAITARREALLVELADAIAAAGGYRPEVIPADLAQRGAAAELADRAVRELGGVDVLVNNAGVGAGGAQWLVGDGDVGRVVFETNVWSPLALIAALVPQMRERGHGAVVNVTSMSQVTPWVGLGHYSASKAAFASFTETLRLELQGSGVHVLEVIPGPVDTAIQAEVRLLPGFDRAAKFIRRGRPARLGQLVVRALERERARVVYPRGNAPAYTVPAMMRVALPRATRAFGVSMDERIVLGGSAGDGEARQAREAWERQQTTGHRS